MLIYLKRFYLHTHIINTPKNYKKINSMLCKYKDPNKLLHLKMKQGIMIKQPIKRMMELICGNSKCFGWSSERQFQVDLLKKLRLDLKIGHFSLKQINYEFKKILKPILSNKSKSEKIIDFRVLSRKHLEWLVHMNKVVIDKN